MDESHTLGLSERKRSRELGVTAESVERVTVPRSSFRSDSGNLDLIRAVAVLSVFFGHLYGQRAGVHDSVGTWRVAQIGVLIFFVHTSMVLMLSLERTPLRGRSLIGSFYLRRAFRLYPFSMVCVSLAMALGVDQFGLTRHWTWGEYASNMALTTNLTYSENMVGGLWTLPIEVQMYLVLPFLFLLGRRHATRALWLVWGLAVPLAILQPHVSARLNVVGYAPCFIAGVMAWKLSLRAKRRLDGRLWPLAFIATWPFFLVATQEHDMFFRWAFCAALGLAIPWFQEIPSGIVRRVAHTIATYSYGIYLTHFAIIIFSFSLPLPLAMQWLVFSVLAVVVPVAVFRGIERPMISLGQKIARRVFHSSDMVRDDGPAAVSRTDEVGALAQPSPP